jgi:CubicO group peptidase (beta-lactamase class C family)
MVILQQLLIILLLASSSFAQGTVQLDSLDVDPSRFNQLFSQLKSGNHKMHSLIVAKDGRLVIEEYFGDQDADTPHDLRSVTKSITSILMGIAIDQGFVKSLDDPFQSYIPQLVPRKNRDSRKAQITIRHLITMTSGLDCNDWDSRSEGQEDRVYRQRDWLQTFVDLPMRHEPGTEAAYCTMGQVLATEIISLTSGMPIDEFANRNLFGPLGITNVYWDHPSSIATLQSGNRLNMTPRDMAKIGQLMLDGGVWNGERIVSEEWVHESTSVKTSITGMDYGLLWWRIPIQVGDDVVVMTAATGNGGQYIFIVPEMDLVAVFTGGAYNSEEDKLPFAVMRDVVLWTFRGQRE